MRIRLLLALLILSARLEAAPINHAIGTGPAFGTTCQAILSPPPAVGHVLLGIVSTAGTRSASAPGFAILKPTLFVKENNAGLWLLTHTVAAGENGPIVFTISGTADYTQCQLYEYASTSALSASLVDGKGSTFTVTSDPAPAVGCEVMGFFTTNGGAGYQSLGVVSPGWLATTPALPSIPWHPLWSLTHAPTTNTSPVTLSITPQAGDESAVIATTFVCAGGTPEPPPTGPPVPSDVVSARPSLQWTIAVDVVVAQGLSYPLYVDGALVTALHPLCVANGVASATCVAVDPPIPAGPHVVTVASIVNNTTGAPSSPAASIVVTVKVGP